jgi:endonuclease/exonuclease/phosphatase family metal-dependent hydrolase
MDFFMTGKGCENNEEQFRLNFKAVDQFLQSQDSVDIFMLQEVDQHSKRSYRFNEVEQLTAAFTDYSSFYGKNYDVFFVPVPPSSPMGSVNSGLLSLSRFAPENAERYSFPGRYSWPTRLFMLDRCFLVMRFEMSKGKQLLVINTHNEAYDDGSIRDQQMAYLKEFMIAEYAKGNYILVGGDWNQCPPGFIPAFSGEVFDTVDYKGIEPDYLPPDWKCTNIY